jgi:hypothetical protein
MFSASHIFCALFFTLIVLPWIAKPQFEGTAWEVKVMLQKMWIAVYCNLVSHLKCACYILRISTPCFAQFCLAWALKSEPYQFGTLAKLVHIWGNINLVKIEHCSYGLLAGSSGKVCKIGKQKMKEHRICVILLWVMFMVITSSKNCFGLSVSPKEENSGR